MGPLDTVYEGRFKSKGNIHSYEELIKNDFVKEYTPGVLFWTPKGAQLLYGVFKMFETEVLIPSGYKRAIFPKTISRETWHKSRHLDNMSSELFFLGVVNKEKHQELFSLTKKEGKTPKEEVYNKFIELTNSGYCHSVCTPIYDLFSNKKITKPIMWYDFSGVSLRNESAPKKLLRLREFHMVDAAMIGKPKDVVDVRKKLLKLYTEVFDKLELEYKFTMKKTRETPEKFEDYKAVPNLIDFEAYVPYDENWLEVGGSFLHGRLFADRFNINDVHTSCSAQGIDRWVEAIVSQNGFDFPEILAKYIE
ncbi:MAG: hypothetical protein GOU98_04395 [Candidatus Altiarchaeota archaeon]|nr:hypothetical protein [Candidatus Altiarchaeota archaeon]